MAKDSAVRIELGRSFHQVGTVNEKVCESDCVPLWDGTIMRHSHLVIWQTLLSKATYNWGIHKAIHLEEAIRQRKCS